MSVTDTIEAEGHLIDSGLLSAIFDKIIEFKGSYEILTFDIGRTNDDTSRIQMRVTAAKTRRRSTNCCQQLTDVRLLMRSREGERVREAGREGSLRPGRLLLDDQSPNARASQGAVGRGRRSSGWTRSSSSTAHRAACRKLRDVRAGEPVVCGHDGIRVTPEFKERDRLGFAFMSNDVSSERRVEGSVPRIAADDARRQEGRAAASPSSPGRSSCTPAASSTSPS